MVRQHTEGVTLPATKMGPKGEAPTIQHITLDAPPSSLMDSIVNPKVKTLKEDGIRAHFLARSTSRVEGCARASRWD
jgi:hypothetical protein